MADALISATIQVTLEMALSLAADRIGLLLGFKKDLASMTRSLGLIRAVLSDAEEKQVQDQAVQAWLKNLEGVAFDADNVMDELNYHFLRHKVKSRNQPKRKVCFFFSVSNCNITFRWRMASKVRDIKIMLNNINQEADELGLMYKFAMISTNPAATGDTRSRQTDSLVAPITGRANDESKIVKMMLSPSEKIISVIPITGMGGLGKTTLAKSIYNNKEIDMHFHKKIWVCVSKEVPIVELFKLILVQLKREKVEVDDRNVIVDEIRKQLGEKRYFLILDDVWNHDQGLNWDDFFSTLKGLNPTNGSWCLVTTRQQQLADTMSRLLMMDDEPYFLGKLSDDDCWCILKEKAIGEGEEPTELKAIRGKVIKRCDGLPLAASVIGGLLRLNAKKEWPSIVEKSLLSGDQSGVEEILKLSFDYLSPSSVKKCFAYCSIFPKDTEMERDSLIELWMAEGFLVPDNETVMEKIGDKYLRVLLQSSLFQDIRDDQEVHYKMHDLVHDLAESVSKYKSVNLETGVIDNNFQVRYLAVNSSGVETLKHLENLSTSLRTLFLGSGMSREMLAKFKNLHVLDLYVAETRELPTTIDKLIHLRYIDLSYNKIQALPESLCKLYNLQTLRLIGCRWLKGLPKGMSNLISLRHLHCYTADARFQMPSEVGRLTCLQTLEFFNVGQEKGQRIEELGGLKGLKGKLVIRNLELVMGKEGAEKADLIGKEDLFRLELLWNSTNRQGDNIRDEDVFVLEGLRPHSNLQELAIQNFMGDQFSQWFMHLSQLVILELSNCCRCRELPAALGRLPSLRDLRLSTLESIRSIGLSFYGIDNHSSSSCSWAVPRTTFFPALKTLSLEWMNNLVEWMGVEEEARSTTTTAAAAGGGGESSGEVVHVFPVLESLFIQECSKLTIAPSQFPSLKELRIENNSQVSLLKNILHSKGIHTTLSTLKIDGGHASGCSVSDMVAAAELLNNNTTTFQNLKHVSFHSCPYLTSLSGWSVCSCLESLKLGDCENLIGKLPAEVLFEFRSLRELEIRQCPRIVIIPEALPNLTSLEELFIDGCNELTNLPCEMPKSLRSLSVVNCPNLVSFPLDLQQTPSLSMLRLLWCPKLKTDMTPKGFGFLTSLREVSVGPFSDDDDENASSSPSHSVYNEFDWSGLKSSPKLLELRLYGLPHMESLPHQVQYLTTLTQLHLLDFGGIEALPDWLGNLQSLQALWVVNCQKLQCLPSMAAMTRLTKLTLLDVSNCPLLKERCSSSCPTQFSEWSNFAHIPSLVIR